MARNTDQRVKPRVGNIGDRPPPPRLVVGVVTVLFVLTAGCQMTTQQQKKAQSEAQWKQVRADVKFRLAGQQFESGLTEDAARTLEEALSLNEKSPDSFILLARVRLEEGALTEARAAVERALALDPMHAEAHYTLGTIEERAMNRGEALHHFAQAEELNPGLLDYAIAHAECLVAMGEPEAAMARIADARNRFPRDGNLEILAAQVAVLLNRDAEAAESYRRALDLLGDHPQTAEQLAIVLARLGRHAEAVGILKNRFRNSSDHLSLTAIRTLATCQMKLQTPDRAAETLDAYLKQHAGDGEIWGLRAQAAVLADRPEDVQRCLISLSRLMRDHPDLNLLRAYLLWREGKPQEARDRLASLVADRGHLAWVHWLYGEILADLDETLDAREHLTRAIQIDPAFERPRMALSRLEVATVQISTRS